uniref:L-ascorbate peroxidase n=1 Tax=Pyramimonas obovata TaxID=1411642 RepID=A0A7S0RPL2_9CHLO|mmetsp:Transcript_38801/g.84448  ORF Transcript_38801/g.84448 Transcript_38801/m.84448 type:complete len:344 (+) Transcript_38801:44-1075(+)|eukprot:CAMPEP_0118926780 /NCGR_PEP_ID=MMETSP1169-20130426/4394_1 /TAXON_ID=36882 /ORGANISM="Pyramimonas obovata, Strain CCMP722" /LENGTH=343 /DNA_ID=CAMNT_0006868403 /DNA_START=26 /DNA_END=1057 /DNA_ORIENTATION=-
MNPASISVSTTARCRVPPATQLRAGSSPRFVKRAARVHQRATAFEVAAIDTGNQHADDVRSDLSVQVGRRAMLTGLTLAAQALTTSSYTWTAKAEAETGRALTATEISALEKAFAKEVPKAKAPAVLRVAFHDAGTFRLASNDGGLNGSVGFELKRPESFGLARGLRPLEKIQKSLEGTPAAGLSLSDLIAYGGAYSVRITGGPAIQVPVGRVDVAVEDPKGRMPSESLNPVELKEQFAAMGFTTRELVAISGAHTIGGKGFGGGLDFDNAYYTTLLDKPWLKGANKEELEMNQMIGLPSDKLLPEDEECLMWIRMYAKDQALFFRDFSSAYLKMIDMGATYA